MTEKEKQQVREKFNEFVKENGKEPDFAICGVNDGYDEFDAVICLWDCVPSNGKHNEEDIYWYCSGIESLLSMTEGDEDSEFVVTEICSFE